jgi:ABC-type transport system substrate-binding protein
MLDPVVGGLTNEKICLRQALSISVDIEEFIDIFMNGRGLAAQGIVPPGIFGHEEAEAGLNPIVYDWVDGSPRRKSLDIAKRLMREAGYPDGVDPRTGHPLLLYMDAAVSGPDDRALLNWYRKQFGRLGVNLVLRTTDYNQFQQKMTGGNAQIFRWGWNADYPDPENFLFLLYGRNGKVQFSGENAANYQNEEFDDLFLRISALEDNEERRQLIGRAQAIIRRDAPWIFGVHPKRFELSHAWYLNDKPNLMANNNLKYLRLDPILRAENRRQWNHPYLWPLVPVALFFLFIWRWISRAYSMKRGETVK